jgi:hypothetical protein
MFSYFLLFISVIAAVSVLLAVFFILKRLRRRRLIQALNLRLLSIRLPRKQSKELSKEGGSASNWKEEVNLSAQLFSALTGLKSPFVFESAVSHVGEEIHFYISVPKDSVEFVSRQIEGFWKEAQVQPADDYNIFSSGGVSQGIYLKQRELYILPIRTYIEAEVDTFAPILSGLSKISEVGEGAAIQILAKPAPASVQKRISQMRNNLKKGAKFEDVLKSNSFQLKDFEKILRPEKELKEKKEEKIIDEEGIKTLEAKISKPLLEVNLRVVVSANTKYQADVLLESIGGGFSQFGAPRRNEIKLIKPRNSQKLIYQFSFREFDDDHTMILNTEELASLFHLPGSSTEIPKIDWLKSKEAAPPADLPTKGTLIGESDFRGQKKQIYITDEDRHRHVYIVGQTGTGKSTLMLNMIVDDIRKGKGVAIVDPHGEFVEKVSGLIPENRLDDVIIFDPGDLWKPLGMNMLEYDFAKPEQKTFIVNELFNIFDKLYDMKTVGGPMFEQYFKNAVLLLMEDAINEPATLMEVQKIFTDDAFRQRKLSRIFNATVVDFWEKEAVKATGEHSLANMSSYITSKLNNFTANDFMRPIIGQTKSAFNFRNVMDERKILLVNLSKGRIGDLNANLLGMVIIGKILMAAFSRVDMPESERKDFNLYIDEFQNFTTDSTATILSEARKYALNLTIAHQFIAQLTEKIRDSVFGNVGSIISFRVGSLDAEFLAKQFEPVFGEADLLNINNFNAYAKILIGGKTTQPFNLRTLPPEKGNPEIVNKIKEDSRSKYGRDRQEVEEEILKRLRG